MKRRETVLDTSRAAPAGSAPAREWQAGSPRGRRAGGHLPGGSRLRGWLVAGGVALALSAALAACAAKAPPPPPKAAGPTPEQAAAAAAAKVAQEQKEAADKIAAEQDALAKQAEDEEARAKAEQERSKLPAEFGTPTEIASTAPAPGSPQSTAQPPTAMQPAGRSASGSSAARAPASSPSAAAPMAAAQGGVPVAAAPPVFVPQKLPPPNTPGGTPFDQAVPPAQEPIVRVGIMSGSSQATAGRSLARMLSGEDRKYLEETLGLGIRVAYVSETDRPTTQRTRVRYRAAFLKPAVQVAALLPQPQQLEVMSETEAARHGVDVLVQIGTDLR